MSTTRAFHLVLLLLLVFGCVTAPTSPTAQTPAPPTAEPQSTAAANTTFTFRKKPCAPDLEQAAKTVRSAYPNYFQGVFIEEVSPTCALVLITEPPPTVAQSPLERALGSKQTKQFTHTMGVDGWVKDFGFVVEHEGPEDFANRLSRVATTLFGTSYGFVPMVVSKIGQTPLATTDISFEVGPATLSALLDRERYKAGSASLSDLLNRQQAGFARGTETAIFILPARTDMCKHQIDLRKFAVETDLVLGVAQTNDATALIGRQRRVAQSILPPLRVETLLALAASNTKIVGQSYERTALPAGLFGGTNQSWAPIHLSPNVIDNEFGGVLNVADQLLKSWSMRGQVQYHPFTYATPSSWPFEQPVLSYFTNSSALTFNWNTDGVSFALSTGGAYDVLGVARTGALPVLYDPGTKSAAVKPYQEQAYDYFATINDPTLARVVQYTIANQALALGKAQATCTKLPSIASLGSSLVRPAQAALIGLRDGTIGVEALAKSALLHEAAFIVPQMRDAGIPEGQAQQVVEQSTQPHLDEVRDVLKGVSDDELAQLAVVLSDRTSLTKAPSKRIQGLQAKLTPQLIQFVVRHAVDITALHQAYQTTLAPQNPYLHTPRIVHSSHATNIALGGGHNISPTPTRLIVADPEVRPGKIRADENDLVVRVNPADVGKVDYILRDLSGLSGSTKTMEARLASATPKARNITHSKAAPGNPHRQLVMGNNASTSLAAVAGWSEVPTPSLSKSMMDALDSASKGGKQRAVLIDREAGSYRAYMKGPDGKISAFASGSNHAILQGLEAAAGKNRGSLAVVFGPAYTARDVSSLRQSLELSNQANVTVRSLAIQQYRGNPVANAKLGEVSDTGMHLGRYELETTVHFEGNGNTPLYFNMTIRSSRPIDNATKLLNRLLPKSHTEQMIEAFLDGAEASAKAEDITLNVGMLYGHTSELDRARGSNGRATL